MLNSESLAIQLFICARVNAAFLLHTLVSNCELSSLTMGSLDASSKNCNAYLISLEYVGIYRFVLLSTAC